MIIASRPVNEEARLAALRQLHVIDTPREPLIDEIAELAAAVCATPIALVTFIADERLWVKSAYGAELSEALRDISFCAQTVAQRELLVVPDAAEDPRFADDPLVIDGPRFRFYAGVPLGEAVPIGTLCVLDTVPRVLGEADAAALRLLASHLSRLLTLRAALLEHGRAGRELEHSVSPLVRELRHDVTWLRGRLGPGAVGPSRAAITSALDEMAQLVDGLATTTSRIGDALGPAPSAPSGLAATLTWICDTFARHRRVHADVSIANEVDAVAPAPALALSALLQDGLDAIASRPGVRAFAARAFLDEELVGLEVRATGGGDGRGEGIDAAKRRAQRAGGDLSVDASEPGTVRITAWLPLSQRGASSSS